MLTWRSRGVAGGGTGPPCHFLSPTVCSSHSGPPRFHATPPEENGSRGCGEGGLLQSRGPLPTLGRGILPPPSRKGSARETRPAPRASCASSCAHLSPWEEAGAGGEAWEGSPRAGEGAACQAHPSSQGRGLEAWLRPHKSPRPAPSWLFPPYLEVSLLEEEEEGRSPERLRGNSPAQERRPGKPAARLEPLGEEEERDLQGASP